MTNYHPCFYGITSDSWEYTDNLNHNEIIVKLGSTDRIHCRKWDYVTYLPHPPKYIFWVEILDYGDFHGKRVKYIEYSIFRYPFFKNRHYNYNAGKEFFKFKKSDNYIEKVCEILLSKNVKFKLHTEDIFTERPKQDEKIECEEPTIRYNQEEGLRYYQEDAIKNMMNNKKGIIVFPTGAGKTITFVTYIKRNPKKYLIVVPTLQLISQTKKVCEYILGDDFSIDEYTRDIETPYSVVITTYQSSFKLLDTEFDCIIFDECHNTVTLTNDKDYSMFQRLLTHSCENKYFFTATIKNINFSDKELRRNISMDNKDEYGEILYKYELDTAIKDGYLSDYTFRINYSDNKKRSLINCIKQRNKIMIFCSTKKRMRKVYDYLKNNLNILVFKLDDDNDVNMILKKFRECEDCSVLISCKKAMVGYDEPYVDCVIHYDISSSSIEILQKNGRALRISPDKIMAKIIFMVKQTDDKDKEKEQIRKLHKTVAYYKSIDKRITKNIEQSSGSSNDVYKKIDIDVDVDIKEYSFEYTRLWSDIIIDKISYVNAKNIVLEYKITSKKDYVDLCKNETRLPEDPEEYFDKFPGWVEYLSLSSNDYYDIKDIRKRIKTLMNEHNIKYNKLFLSKNVEKLCELDIKFPKSDMWEIIYKKRLVQLIPKQKSIRLN